MFQKISNSWRLAKESWGVLQQDRELMMFPVLSAVATIALMISFFVPVAYVIGSTDAPISDGLASFIGYGSVFAFYFIAYAVMLSCNAALLYCAKIRFEGGDPTMKDGFRAVASNFRAILGWAALSATLGVLLAKIEEHLGFAGTIIRSFVGGAWTVITYFATPVIIFEGLGPIDGLKQSKAIIEKTWGEALVSVLGIRAAQNVITFLAFLILISGVVAGIMLELPYLALASGVIFMLILLGSSIVFSCLSQIYCAALYVFATTNEPPSAFSRELIEGAFSLKK